MASTTAASTSWLEIARAALSACWLLWAAPAAAAEVEVVNPQLTASEDGYVVAADFNFDFNQRLEEAVTKGVVLHFVVDFELTRPRWYWFDEKLVSRSQTYRLSYHALTRQYRLSTGALHQSVDTLSEALRILARLRNWVVVDKPAADKGERPPAEKGEKGEKTADKPEKPLPRPGETYQGAVRLRLDINQLPKPFQIAALGNKDWNLASDWKVWSLMLPPLVPPAEAK